jgi:hypothetical protein
MTQRCSDIAAVLQAFSSHSETSQDEEKRKSEIVESFDDQ